MPANTERETSSQGFTNSLPIILALILAALFAARQISTWPVRLLYPGDQTYVEGILLAELLHVRQGVPIYAPPVPERFDPANYGPLYYLSASRLVDPHEPAYFPLRLPAMFGTLACAGGSALLAFWVSRSYWAAMLAPLLFLASAVVSRPGVSARSDSVAVALVFAAFLVAFRFVNTRGLLLSVPLLLLGFFYKQQFIAAPLAILIFLLLEKRRRRAAEFAGLAAAGGLAGLALFQFVIFPGQAFLQHFSLYNVLPFSRGQFTSGVVFTLVVLLVPIVLARQSFQALRDGPHRLLKVYLACAVLLSLVTMAREGSAWNYFLECILILSSLVAAWFAGRVTGPARSAEPLLLLFVVLLLAQLFSRPVSDPEDFERDRAVQSYLRASFAPGAFGLGYFAGDLVRAGLVAPVSNLFHFSWLVRRGVLSDRPLAAQIEARRFAVVTLTFDLERETEPVRIDHYLTPALRRAILENYRLAAILDLPRPQRFWEEDRFYAWVPRFDEGQKSSTRGSDHP